MFFIVCYCVVPSMDLGKEKVKLLLENIALTE